MATTEEQSDSGILEKLRALTTKETMDESINIEDEDTNTSINWSGKQSRNIRVHTRKRHCPFWTFFNDLIVIEQCRKNTLPEEYELNQSEFWIQLHNLPLESRTYVVAHKLACRTGRVLDVMTQEGILHNLNFTRVRVTVDINNPLQHGVQMMYQGKERWVKVKYGRLPRYCLFYGRLGHVAGDAKWGAVYIPSIITLLNAVGTPRLLHLVVLWILFENAMSLHRTKATSIGLLDAGRVNERVVTEKLGDVLKNKAATKASKKSGSKIGERLHILELRVGPYLFFCACYDLSFGKNHYFIFLFLQSFTFFVLGFGYVGTFVPHSY